MFFTCRKCYAAGEANKIVNGINEADATYQDVCNFAGAEHVLDKVQICMN